MLRKSIQKETDRDPALFNKGGRGRGRRKRGGPGRGKRGPMKLSSQNNSSRDGSDRDSILDENDSFGKLSLDEVSSLSDTVSDIFQNIKPQKNENAKKVKMEVEIANKPNIKSRKINETRSTKQKVVVMDVEDQPEFDLDSPYQGEDKDCLDIIPYEGNGNSMSLFELEKNELKSTPKPKRTYDILDPKFIFGDSGSKEKKSSREESTPDRLSTSDFFLDEHSGSKTKLERIDFKEPQNRVEEKQLKRQISSEDKNSKTSNSSPKIENPTKVIEDIITKLQKNIIEQQAQAKRKQFEMQTNEFNHNRRENKMYIEEEKKHNQFIDPPSTLNGRISDNVSYDQSNSEVSPGFVDCVVELDEHEDMDDDLYGDEVQTNHSQSQKNSQMVSYSRPKTPDAPNGYYRVLKIESPIDGKNVIIEVKRIKRPKNLNKDPELEKFKKLSRIDPLYMSEIRRSTREKKEKKGPDGDDFDYSFVEYKQYKPIQKIRVLLSFKSILIMNIHAHLSKMEVIGIIGGTLGKKDQDEIIVEEALPCRNVSESTSNHSVEMDSVSQVESQEKLEKMGYKTLGWYHSHPTFKVDCLHLYNQQTTPSQIDQTTHLEHQAMYKDHPYVGVIVGPYGNDKSSSRTKGDMFVFHVNMNQTFKLNYDMKPMSILSNMDWEEIVEILVLLKKQKNLVEREKKSSKGIRFDDNWYFEKPFLIFKGEKEPPIKINQSNAQERCWKKIQDY